MNVSDKHRDLENLMDKNLAYFTNFAPAMRDLALTMLWSGNISQEDFCTFVCLKTEKVKKGWLLSVCEEYKKSLAVKSK